MAVKNSSLQSNKPKKTAPTPRKKPSLSIPNKGAPAPAASRSRKKPVTTSTRSQDGPPRDPPDLHARIADRAHELYTHRGGHHGMDQEDWFEAERQVLDEGC